MRVRDKRVPVQLTYEEKEQIRRHCHRTGTTMQAFSRGVLLNLAQESPSTEGEGVCCVE